MNLRDSEALHTRPSAPYPSGRRYPIWKLRTNGRTCRAPGCGSQILTPNPDAEYCSDPICQAIYDRRYQKRKKQW